MGRPPNINELLSIKKNAEKQTSGSDNLRKPKFLSKSERSQLISPPKHIEEISQAANIIKKRPRVEEGSVESEQDFSRVATPSNGRPNIKKPKFQFEWKETEDTLSDYKPIISTSFGNLLNTNKVSDSLVDIYMGKHWREKKLEEMTERDWRIFCEDFSIRTKGGAVKYPLRKWDESDLLTQDIFEILTKDLGYSEPTPIQRVTIPNVCTKRRRDFLGVACTGSGKTLAFVIPILIKMSNAPPRPQSLKVMEGPKALILAPTRELVQQIQKEAQRITSLWTKRNATYSLRVISIVGGHSLEEITHQLSQGCDIIVATPGRLIDCMESHLFSSGNVDTLVMDEADKMIDMGFEEQVTTILSRLNFPSGAVPRQTLMFTATMSPTIEKIANGYLTKPAYATVGGGEDSVPSIQQCVYYISSEEQRFKNVKKLLNIYEAPIILFITYKKTADWLAKKFYEETSFKVTILHGSKSQEQREHSLQLLRNGKCQIMIATNVAARGLDIPDVSLVINFQMSKSLEDYIHRIGRTGRAGKKGTAITYVGDDENDDLLKELHKYVERHDTTKTNVFDKVLKLKYGLGKDKIQEIVH